MNKKTLELPDIFIAGTLFLFTVWEALCGFILHFDAAARIPHILLYISLITALVFCNGLQLLKNSMLPLGMWLVWAVYSVSNACIKSYGITGFDSIPYFIWLFTAKWIYMMLILIMLRRHERFTMSVLSGALILIAGLFMFFGEEEALSNEGHVRLFAEGVINPNSVAFSCVVLLILALYWLVGIPRRIFPGILCAIVTTAVIVITVSRTAAVSALVVLLTAIFIWLHGKKLPMFKIICLTVLISAISWLLLSCIKPVQDSAIMYRFNVRTYEIEQFELENNLLTRIMGERSVYFYEGMELFRIDPLTGIGMNNYIIYSSYELRCHVEYIAQLVEGGIIGAALYCCWLLTLLLPLRFRNATTQSLLLYYCSAAALLLYGVGSYTSMKDSFYILCALVLYSKLKPEDFPPEKQSDAGAVLVNDDNLKDDF